MKNRVLKTLFLPFNTSKKYITYAYKFCNQRIKKKPLLFLFLHHKPLFHHKPFTINQRKRMFPRGRIYSKTMRCRC